MTAAYFDRLQREGQQVAQFCRVHPTIKLDHGACFVCNDHADDAREDREYCLALELGEIDEYGEEIES